ncbi:unnamed protein product, partial [marine sediment metagenome]
SLIQTKMLQKAEKRERLLNEIIEWAIDACDLVLVESLLETSQLHGEMAHKYLYARTQELGKFRKLKAKSVYIKKLTWKYPILETFAVEVLIDRINEQIQFLFQFTSVWPNGEGNLAKSAKEAFLNNEKIYTAATHVIDDASRII